MLIVQTEMFKADINSSKLSSKYSFKLSMQHFPFLYQIKCYYQIKCITRDFGMGIFHYLLFDGIRSLLS